MTETTVYALTLVVGTLAGLLTARAARRRVEIGGGWSARVCHDLAAMFFTTLSLTVPMLVVGLILGVYFRHLPTFLLGLTAMLALSLLSYAALDAPARGADR